MQVISAARARDRFQLSVYTIASLVFLSLLLRIIFYTNTNLLVEEAYYWNYGQHLDFGYLDHPPMVGILIRLSTELFGINEWAVRVPALLCWGITVYFNIQLTRHVAPGARNYTILLLALLPFFFLQSLATTPDLPLLVFWSASLYYLYAALIKHQSRAWMKVGLACGLGLISKYTIALLAPATLAYMFFVPSSRYWLRRPEPYCAAGLALICFSPVIYWNATHAWVSFAFQSSRRLNETTTFSLHMVIGLLIFFLMPIGLTELMHLFKPAQGRLKLETMRFLQIYTLFPLLVFSVFSLTHPVKFNWIGPSLLAVIPWLSCLLEQGSNTLHRRWLLTLVLLSVVYSGLVAVIAYGMTLNMPKQITVNLLTKFIDWQRLTKQLIMIAEQKEQIIHSRPVIVALDRYNIASELAFYQAKLHAQGVVPQLHEVTGSHVFGDESLMYRYWLDPDCLLGKSLLLISDNRLLLDNPLIKARTTALSSVGSLWTYSQGSGVPIKLFYYQLVKVPSA